MGSIPLERLRDIQEGMTPAEVETICGPPKERLKPGDVISPTEFWQSIGSTFQFDLDCQLEEVWVYQHDRRGKLQLNSCLRTFIGFRNGLVTGAWQVQDATEERLQDPA
jgi:hypothetical protein